MNKTCFYILLLLPVVFVACKTPAGGLAGQYETAKFSKLRMSWDYLTKGKAHTFGNSLVLEKDSSYTYTTCGNISTGRWRTIADTLLLFEQTNRWRNDSLHEHGWEGRQLRKSNPHIPEKFLISGNRLTLSDNEFLVILEKREEKDNQYSEE